MASLLQVENISKSFVGIRALSEVGLSVEAGEIHALLGENGAGKSTLMKILCGVYQPDSGLIAIDGVEHHFAGYKDAVHAGIGIVFQEFSLIPHLNAVENIFLGREKRNALGLMQRGLMRGEAEAILQRLGVAIPLHMPVASLSVAQQQFIEIAKALALNARILILDEPTATLTPSEAEHLFTIMRELKRQGVAMIFISHHLEEIFQVCDRITVFRDGRRIGDRDVAATNVDELVEMMVGRRIEKSFPPKPEVGTSHEIVLDVQELQLDKRSPVNSFQLRKGEILGFAGLVGSGRTETALAVIGYEPAVRKTMQVRGKPASIRDPSEALANGIGILPESRKTEGLITPFNVRSNITLNNLAKYRRWGMLVDRGRERQGALDAMRRVRVKANSTETVVETLSGGNQQKVVIARWLDHHADILIFDEPTRGIDVGAKAEIYQIMRDLTAKGLSIVMISSELPEVVGMCDRVAVFRQGRIVGTLESPQITPENVMRLATAGESHEQQ
ncbi:monosaccharide ABC transporter ATP-binding protein, CUT2 family [Faunimonas pinastri]|uniref:Monosaccharide ABC transporter ATP-binding protein, CUT2 family n=1 Tax=Faunimonas pinastri TaxID=1855383 RepID=A0A1H9IJQ5_9HYPH|nr:sugar ABC transporter ATP-binding protein [Faunimonas pinastri]SEQ74625.1 monosaccharide ABC transporter ATP-binding protein, CUT2 family [Faunimonas pinastri]